MTSAEIRPSAGRAVITNSIALYVLYGVNFLFPLITVPYLLRVLGVAPFGAIAFSGSILQVVSIVTTFTFHLTATPIVATQPSDRALQGALLSTVAISRGALLIASLAVLAVVTALVPELRDRWLLLVVQLPIAAADLLFPSWLFAGVQRIVLITALNAVSRVVTLGLLFLFVRAPDDVAWAAGVQASHFLISGLLSQLVLWRVLGVRYEAPLRGSELRSFLTDSWRMFVASAAGNVYVRGSMVVLGFFAGDVALGHFALVQKISSLLTGLVSPLSQAVFPHAAQVWKADRAAFRRLQRRLIGVLALLLGVALLVLNLTASWVVELVAGEPTPEVVTLLRWFTPTILATALSTIVTTMLFATRRYDGVQSVFVGAAALFLVAAPPLAYLWQGIGMTIALLVVELFMAVGSLRLAARSDDLGDARASSTEPSP